MATKLVERRRPHGLREKSEPDFRGIFATTSVGIALLDRAGRTLESNPTLQRLLGCSDEDLIGKRLWEYAQPVDGGSDIDQLWRMLMGQSRQLRFESRFVAKNGETLRGRMTLSRLRRGADRRVFGAAVFERVTERALPDLSPGASRTLVEEVFSSLGGYVAAVDGEGNVLAANDAWARFARETGGRAIAPQVGANYIDACRSAMAADDPHAAATLAAVVSVLAGQREQFKMEYVCPPGPGGTERWLEMSIHPLRRPAGGAIVSHSDVTERHRAEIDARDMRLQLAHLARVAMMGELTASLAHELSQPLTAILTNAQAAQRFLQAPSPDRLKLREALDDIVAGEKRAGEIIRRVHNLLQKRDPEYRAFDLNALIAEVVALVRGDALAKSVTVKLRLAPDLPNVNGDRVGLQQVLLNLVLNALEAMKEVPADERRLDIASAQIDESHVEVSVLDTGTGIAPELIDKVFDRFVGARPQGLGMGLAICRSIVQAHGGRIWCRNPFNRGAEFRFTVPASGPPTR